MTKERKLEILKDLLIQLSDSANILCTCEADERCEVVEECIKALEQQSDDCVSRQAVTDAIENTIAKYIPTFIGLYEKIPLELARAIKDVPPVTPTRNKPKEDITEDEVRINMLELALNQAKEHAESIEVLTENHRLIFRAEKRGDSDGSN